MTSHRWDHTETTTARGYGWQWQKLRQRILQRDKGLCQPCRREGRITPAKEVDHITPKAKGGTDEAQNLQAICRSCHKLKSAVEASDGQHGAAHPAWLQRAACPLTIICGPAGSGKTTMARALAGPADTVIDLDDCFQLVCGVHGHDADKEHLGAALTLRNKLIAQLERKTEGEAFLIVGAPTKRERDWWQVKTGGLAIVIDPGLEAIRQRDISDRRKRLAVEWYDRRATDDWREPKVKQAIGADGWPA